MNRILVIAAMAILLMACAKAQNHQQTNDIKLNSLGFQPESIKQATITTVCKDFKVIDAVSGKTAFKGKTSALVAQSDVNQTVVVADFSKLKKPGTYYLVADTLGKSYDFVIADDAYNFAYKTSMRAFYLWRCGTAVSGDHNGNHYAHEACHMNDGYTDYIGKKGEIKDGTGGWHDAGDHGKYTVNAGVTMGLLFYAWEHFGDNLKKIALEIPETTPGLPEFLQELKWETDFLLKMQYSDGTGKVSHKLTRVNFEGFVMPENDTEKRFFTDWSSAGVADFVAMMAMAYRTFKPYDEAYAQKCLDAALLSYDFLVKNPEFKNFVQGDFRTGGYQTKDADDRLWAAAEIWEATGDAVYLEQMESQIAAIQGKADFNWDWSDVNNLGLFTYAMSKRDGRNADLLKTVKASLVATADSMVDLANSDVYGRTLGGKYYWGCNGTVGRQALNLQIANLIAPDAKYTNAIQSIISHLFGRNYYGRSYVTGLGVNPPMHPHDRRSGADGIEAPWPGYIVGGGHKATDWVDKEASYSHNEVAINWQAGLVYALAAFVK